MEQYNIIKSKIAEEIYLELELFLLNNTNFSENQNNQFIKIIEKIIKND